MSSEVLVSDAITVELIQSYGSDEMVARAARVSTGKDQIDGASIDGLIRYLLANGHSSPLEHCGATFYVSAPMFVRDQWVRHRTQSFNVKSLRFSDANPVFYVPPVERPLHNAGSGAHPNLVPLSQVHDAVDVRLLMSDAYMTAWDYYEALLDLGVAGEVARAVLPTGLYTQFYATANLWNWIKFLEKRVPSEHNSPQWEIVVSANKVRAELERLFPVVMQNVKLT